jgi:pimeloyl-ACP methyl ester carboxylesterase
MLAAAPGRSPRPRSKGAAPIFAAIVAACLCGCAIFGKYDMARIHQDSAARSRNPVIVLHGFIGAKLKNRKTEKSVWGRLVNAVKRSNPDDLGLPIDRLPITENRDDLVPYAIYEKALGVKFYGAILEALEQVGGYRRGEIKDPRPGDSCFVYYYDWRRDLAESAIGLGHAIEELKVRLKAPHMRFDIVAHSMGGLVAQYYLKYGAEDVVSDGRDHPVTYAGAANLGRIVLIGTPHRGTMTSFGALNAGISQTLPTEVVFTMPSIYQLLPRRGQKQFIDPEGNPVEADLYDARTWVKNGWSVFNPRLERTLRKFQNGGGATAGGPAANTTVTRFLQAALDRARAFHAAMDRDDGKRSPVPIHLFGSDCVPTPDRAVLKQTSAGTITLIADKYSPERELKQLESTILVPGDGTVTAESLLGIDSGGLTARSAFSRASQRFASTFFFCETHGLLPANRGFQDNLFYVLLQSPPRSAPVATFAGGP